MDWDEACGMLEAQCHRLCYDHTSPSSPRPTRHTLSETPAGHRCIEVVATCSSHSEIPGSKAIKLELMGRLVVPWVHEPRTSVI
ncbi:hypothetical protein E2C01_047756 [Portunus trituberculatus]|uniref:Uncharacterized protein n=1 Tax=Portunus trituberculatus TaxID=210409 RepID=A0A5B7G9D5_PORTR|nr:hypothetical protein [Portunus trituberculatus]